MATGSAAITRKDMAELVMLVQETEEEEVNVMSPIVYEAFKEDLEAATKAAREVGRREVEKIRREAEERREAAARVLLESGVDAHIVCKALGYARDELADLYVSTVN